MGPIIIGLMWVTSNIRSNAGREIKNLAISLTWRVKYAGANTEKLWYLSDFIDVTRSCHVLWNIKTLEMVIQKSCFRCWHTLEVWSDMSIGKPSSIKDVRKEGVWSNADTCRQRERIKDLADVRKLVPFYYSSMVADTLCGWGLRINCKLLFILYNLCHRI